jgi:hypothetical protein
VSDPLSQVSFNRLVKERVFFEETVSDDDGGRASPVSRPFSEKHPASASFHVPEGQAFRSAPSPPPSPSPPATCLLAWL